MPLLALVLCTAFVLFLLWIERRALRGVSSALWIPTLWMLIVASRPLPTWFYIAGDFNRGNESGSELDRWVLTALAVAAIIVLVRRRTNWWGSLRAHKWLLLLLAYMFVSTVWSEITLIALKRWIRELIVVVMALVIMSEVNPRDALASLLRRCAYVLVPFSVVLIRYYPSLGRVYGKWSGIEMWTGVTGQKNHLGRLCMISILFLLWVLHRRWRERPRRKSFWKRPFRSATALVAPLSCERAMPCSPIVMACDSASSTGEPAIMWSCPPIRDAAKVVPLDRMLIETDSPYLAPVPHRGKRNEPSFVVSTAEAIAQLRGMSKEDIGQQTTQNFYMLFPQTR